MISYEDAWHACIVAFVFGAGAGSVVAMTIREVAATIADYRRQARRR